MFAIQEPIIKQLEEVNYPKGLSKIARDMFAEYSGELLPKICKLFDSYIKDNAKQVSVFEVLNRGMEEYNIDIAKLMIVFADKLEMMNPHDNNIKIIQTICTKCSGELVIIIGNIYKIIDMLKAQFLDDIFK